jgi:hypothetical protein
MNQIRTQLTKLKNRIIEVLPDGGDIFGFPGVSKSGVIECLERAYTLTGRIEKLRHQFPIVALKRKLQPYLDACKSYLDEDLEGKKSAQRFDGFLSSLTKIHDEISLTYTVYLSETVYEDSEFQGIRLKTEQLVKEFAEVQPKIEELLGHLERIEQLDSQVEVTSQDAAAILAEIKSAQAKVTDAATAATVKAEVITKYESETKVQKSEIADLTIKAAAMEKKLKALLSEGQQHVRASEENLGKIAGLEAENTKQQQAIAQTLRLASKFGMAASFKERKDELRWSMWAWATAFAAAVVGIFCTAVLYIVPQFDPQKFTDTGNIIVKVSLLAPLIWLGWMSARQYGFISRIREDYSFKYASALAFEGYKKEAAEVDPKMLRDLLGVATENMSLNPLRIYGDNDTNHASPIHEALAHVFGKKADTDSKKGMTEEKERG